MLSRFDHQEVLVARLWLACACLWLACGGPSQNPGTTGQSVEIDGDITAIDGLVGDWVGSFVDADTGDNGSLRFRLEANTQTGTSELILHPNAGRHGLTIIAMREFQIDLRGRLRILYLSFADIQCRCDIRIELTGQRLGDEMSGSYARIRRDMSMQTGRWSMTRQ